MIFRTIICSLFYCLPLLLNAQWRGPLLEYLGPEEGLNAEVRDIAQDSTGYMYFATEQGLYQYDGNSFAFYGHDPDNPSSIAPGIVYKLIVSSKDIVWMALQKSGLCSFNPRTGRFNHYPLPEHDLSFLTGAISICEDNEGTIWVGSHHYRLFSFDPVLEKFKLYTPGWSDPSLTLNQRNGVTSIVQDKKDPDIIWITIHRLDIVDPAYKYQVIVSLNRKTGVFTHYPCHGVIRRIDDKGNVWTSPWNSFIVRFNPQGSICDTIYYSPVFDIPAGEKGPVSHDILFYDDKMLIASHGLISYDLHHKFELFIKEFRFSGYHTLFEDKEGNLWIGHAEGVDIYNKSGQQIQYYSLEEFGLEARIFPGRLAFHAEREEIFLIQNSDNPSGGIFSISSRLDEMETMAFHQLDIQPTAVAVDNSGKIWLAANQSLFNWNPETGKVNEKDIILDADPEEFNWLQYMDATKRWVIGVSNHTLFWFDPKQQNTTVHHLPLSVLDSTLAPQTTDGFSILDDDHVLFFGGGMLMNVNLENGNARELRFGGIEESDIDLIQYARQSKDGSIWVTTQHTLFQFHQEGDSLKLRDKFTIKDGIQSPTISEFHLDRSGRVWLFSNSGMNSLDPRSGEMRYFGVKDGLPAALIDPRQVIETEDGTILTVCKTGIIFFHPDSLWKSKDSRQYPVVISDMRINGEKFRSDTLINFIQSIYLPKGTSVLDLKVQSLAFPTDFNSTYSYRLREIGENWISIGKNNLITLPSLPYGKTTFEVKTGGPLSMAPVKQLIIHLPTPVHARWWFYPGIVFLLLSTLVILYRRRIQLIEHREREQTKINKQFAELELKALRSQMNPHFMFNSLNSIKTYIIEAKPEVAADYLSQFAHLIRRILQNSREKFISLKEEIETLQLYIGLEQFRFENAFDFHCVVDEKLDASKIFIPPMLLQPHVENAIWHGLMHKGEGGVLDLRFKRENGTIQCIVEDNGVGREQAKAMKSLSARRHKSMGMGITQNRVDLMNSIEAMGISIEIQDMRDNEGEAIGTRVIVSLPVKQDSQTEILN